MLKLIRKYRSHRLFQAIPFWGAAVLVGAVAVGYAEAFKYAERFSQWLVVAHPYYMLVLTPVSFLAAWWIVQFSPDAKGSGLPQVMVASIAARRKRTDLLNRLVGLRVAVVKILSSVVCVIGGGAVGREGPTAQVGASLFYAVGTWFEKMGFRKISAELWIITGSAAGIAAAFNTPLGGIVFAIEELSQASFHRLKMLLIGGVITAGLMAQWLSGPYLYLGYPVLKDMKSVSFFWVVLIAALCGVLGAAFARLLYWILSKVKTIDSSNFPFFVVLMGVLVAWIGILIGPYSIGAGREVLVKLLFNEASIDWKVGVARFFTPLLTYAAGVSGGVFAPSLSIGGCIGYLFAVFFGIPNIHLFVMLGMIGFLTGVTRAPFTTFVLVLEMTDRHSVIFPMMSAASIAIIFANMIDRRSFYSKVKRDYWITRKVD